MAIYVYKTATGVLVSSIPASLTIAQAQASGRLASDAELAAGNNTAVDNLPPLDSTHKWDEATHTVITVAAPTPAQPMPLVFFLQRFTPAEYSAVGASSDPATAQFWDIIRRANVVDMSDPAIIAAGTRMVTQGLLTGPRATAIYTTPYVPTSQTS